MLSYIDRVMPILNYFLYLEQHSEWVPFRDMPSHLALVRTCLKFISVNIAAFSLVSLETCPPIPSYVST